MATTQPVGVLPPPPGVTPNFVNPPNQVTSTIILHTVLLTFATLSVVLRIYSRAFIVRSVWWDDYLIILAWFMTVTFSALLLLGDARGLGHHMWDVTVEQFICAIQALTFSEYIYLPLVAVIKLSCLMFYWRVFSPSQKMKYLILGGIFGILAAYTAVFFRTIFLCIPVQAAWDILITDAHCLKSSILPYASGAVNVVSDLYVLILPFPVIWGMNMDRPHKMRVLALFGLGIFVCATSIVRLGMTSILYSNTDRTWNLDKIGLWAVIEVNVGIICACCLAFPPLIDRWGVPLWKKVKSYRGSSSGQNTGSKTNRTSQRPTSWSGVRGPIKSYHEPPTAEEYAKLEADHNATNMQEIDSSKRSDYNRSSRSNISREDVESNPRSRDQHAEFEFGV